jgi:GxxExxY protein
MNYLHQELTEQIIQCFFEVYRQLGFGFLEKVYEHAMIIELQRKGLHAKGQRRTSVFYKGLPVGEYFADIVVEEAVIIELKTAETLVIEHETQLINYLRATNIEVGLLLNFGKKPEIRRKIFTNDRKTVQNTVDSGGNISK